MSSKLTTKTPGRGQLTSFGIFFGNFLMEGMIRLVRTQNFLPRVCAYAYIAFRKSLLKY